jgi:hypothetical protein
MANIGQLKDRNSKIERGAWVKDLPNLQDLGIAVKVKAYGSTEHARAMGDAYGKLTLDERANSVITDEIDDTMIVKHLLLDWSGLDDMPYSIENAFKVMTDPDFLIMKAGIRWATMSVAQNGHDTLEADAKNLSALSDGTSTGQAGLPTGVVGARPARKTRRQGRRSPRT